MDIFKQCFYDVMFQHIAALGEVFIIFPQMVDIDFAVSDALVSHFDLIKYRGIAVISSAGVTGAG